MIGPAVAELAEATSTVRACALLGRPRASHYRSLRRAPTRAQAPRQAPPNALSDGERAEVLTVLDSPRLVDRSVAQTWAVLLDEGVYLASRSTLHRVLRAAGQSRERRAQAVHPARTRPELMATTPGQVWSWDITKLRGPDRGVW